MRTTRTALFALLAAFCVSSVYSADKLELVEEHWPNGQLRLRKQVLHREDGSVVDHGSFKRWHDNGKKEYEAVFVEGKKEGTTIRYHKNGRKAAQQEYRNGKRHGRCVNWDGSGRMVKEENWAEGKPHGTWTVWQDGKVKWSHTYDHGKP
jgi:antitoxin component YwqK of YwqJK toxin-antitoxin module